MRGTFWLFTTLFLFTISHFASANIFEKPLKLEEKEVHPISQKIDSLELRYAFLFDDKNNHDLFHSVRLYNTDNDLLQTIEGEELREHMFWGQIGSTPELVDINEDGYLDLIIKVSAGSLGEFSTVWLFNPETKRYQAVLEEILYPEVVGKNLVSSTYTSRHDPFISYLSAFQILPDFSIKEAHWTSFIIPLKKAGESYYCVSHPYLNNSGDADYSLEIILNDDEELTAESLASFNALNMQDCYPSLSEIISSFPKENFRSLSLIQLPIMLARSGEKQLFTTISINPQWQKIAVDFNSFGNKITTMECPTIPYVDLDLQRIHFIDLITFEGLSENIVEDYGYPVICDYDGAPYH